MLELKRKVGESILIGQDIKITYIDNGADGIRLGISAPRSIQVDREEVRKKRHGIHPGQKTKYRHTQ